MKGDKTMASNKFYGRLMATSDVAKRFKVTTTTVIGWANRGWLPYTDLSNGVERQFYGFREEDVAAFDPAEHRGRPGRKKVVKVIVEEMPKKNLNKVQTYWGYNFFFGSEELRERFLQLYEDLFLDTHIDDTRKDPLDEGVEKKHHLHVVVEKGTIPMIKEALGDMVKTKYKRYYIGCNP